MQGIDNLNTERAEKLHDYTNGYYPEWIEDHEFQPVYAKLGKMITDRIPYKLGLKPITKYEPECTDYQKSEDKLKLILPYAAKQAIQIRKKEKAAKVSQAPEKSKRREEA
jgi:hypothetical protein